MTAEEIKKLNITLFQCKLRTISHLCYETLRELNSIECDNNSAEEIENMINIIADGTHIKETPLDNLNKLKYEINETCSMLDKMVFCTIIRNTMKELTEEV